MPTTAYTHYKDPETDSMQLLPQLFPHSVSFEETSHEQIQEWIKLGIIPLEVYEEEVRGFEWDRESKERLKKGEKVSASECPVKPWALVEFLTKNKAQIYGEQVFRKIFSRLLPSDPDVVWLSFIKEALTAIASKDPLPIHYLVARSTLEKFSIDDSSAIDSLARGLVEICQILLKLPSLNHKIFEKASIVPSDLEEHFENTREKGLSLNIEFASFLSKIGPEGKKIAKEVTEKSSKIYENYKSQGYCSKERPRTWDLWAFIPDFEQETLVSPFLRAIAKALWVDKYSTLHRRKTKETQALTKPIMQGIKGFLSPKDKKKYYEKDENIICTNDQGILLATTPAIDPELLSLFQKGIKELSTLTGHRMLRWEIMTGFNQWMSGKNDPRLVEIEGGFSKIAELAGCASTKEITKVKSILHAQAHGNFFFPDGSKGNMLSLRILRRHKNNEPCQISLVLGDMLLPSYVFKMSKHNRLLIPIGDLPPLYGYKNTHANQAFLQLLVFEELSNQSDRLAEKGSVIITSERWEKMGLESGLSPNQIPNIINYWCQPDLFNCFLEKQGDEYKLASYYERAHKFLMQQGEIRISKSILGKKSYKARKGKKV